MQFVPIIALLFAVAASTAQAAAPNGAIAARSQEFRDIVNYLDYYVSQHDIDDMLEVLPEALDAVSEDEDSEANARSLTDHIPWDKVLHTLESLAKGNSKFSKVVKLVSDPKFQELVKKAVNSQTLRSFLKDVATHGFSWTEFLHLLLHALCSTATTIQHDRYTTGACKILQNL